MKKAKWDSLVKRATRAETKAKMQASVSHDDDQHCHQGNRPMHTTAIKAQAQTTKYPRAKESKARGPEPLSTPQRSNNNELSDKARKEKKKEQRRRD